MSPKRETYYVYLMAAFAALAVLAVALIFGFVLKEGWPVFSKIGAAEFVFGGEWSARGGRFGLLPLIAGSFSVVLGALLLGVPAGVITAVFLVEYSPRWLAGILRPAVDLLAGIPSVVYGFFGIVTILPLMQSRYGGTGMGIAAASIVLAIMILPTITSISRDALEAVPGDYRLGGLALGATQWRTIYNVIVPAASSGIVTAVILGMGRAIGETMAVYMLLGNTPRFPTSLGRPVSALTSQIALDMSYASGVHRTALFGIGVVLLLITAGLVSLGRASARRGVARRGAR
ncbi:MAG: phosphate ABC transporter permease subunit PstC [Actinobacteria bacterium]|nr:MAG: phosphate ABC transporter permease subunit PstC [Actinomycetota bacterium]